MQPVYQAENLFDAHLLRDRLGAEGITSFVHGEYLAGAMGELPMAGLLTVCVVDSDLERALELLQRWQDEPSPVLEDDLDALPDADGDVLEA